MSRRLFWPGLFTLASLAILLWLGAWQWRRMGEKEGLIAAIHAREAMVPQQLPDPTASFEPQAINYMPVTLTGSFLGQQEAHVFFSLAKPVNGVSGPGYLILQPFQLDDGRVVLVNRGFAPADKKDLAKRPESVIAGSMTITGTLRLPEVRGPFSGADDPVKNIYYVRDPLSIARGMGLTAAGITVAPYIVDLKSPVPPAGLPMPGTTQVDIPNNHFQYALTWWSLAAVLGVIFLIYARQQHS